MRPFDAGLKKFADPDADLSDHSGELEQGLEDAIEKRNTFAAGIIYSTRVFFYFIVGDYGRCIEMMDGRLSWLPRMDGSVHEGFAYFLEALSFFGTLRKKTSTSAPNRRKFLKRARSNTRSLKCLSKQNPSCALAKFVLLDAENAALSKRYTIAGEKYDHAISMASKYKNYFELAYANQVAGRHYIIDRNDISTGIQYYNNAIDAYRTMGGHAAATFLTNQIRDLEGSRSTS